MYSLNSDNQVYFNSEPLFNEGKYLCGTPYKHPIKSTQEVVDKANTVKEDDFPFEVEAFNYNGFGVQRLNTKSDYKARFVRWTNDPGIFYAQCSDGQDRLIPSCQIYGLFFMLPKQTYEERVLFGASSQG